MIADAPWRQELILLAIGGATGLATLAGGALALRLGGRRDWMSAFAGGALLSVALSELLPEALSVASGRAPAFLTLTTLAGFAVYLAVEGLGRAGLEGKRTALGPLSLVLHSLADGLAVGVAFDAAFSTGVLVTIAVVTHDLLDGANTVILSLNGEPKRSRAKAWLLADAAAPMVGILIARALGPPAFMLPYLLSLFAGFFIYIGAREIFALRQGRPAIAAASSLAGMILVAAIALLTRGA